MSPLIFPEDRTAFVYGEPGSPLLAPEPDFISLFSDEACTIAAPVTDLDGIPLPSSRVQIGDDTLIPQFLCTDEDLTVLWAKVGTGDAYPLYAGYDQRFTATEQRLVALEGAEPGSDIDHGTLLGLSDDDHPQYLTEGRGDARYATDAELTTGLAGKANVAHTHVVGDVAGLQAALDAKASNAVLNSESAARIAADEALDTRLEVVEARPVPDVTAADLAAEVSTLEAVDAALDARLDTVEARPVPDVTAADLAAHASDSTGVHGIADTAALVLTGDARLSDARTPLTHTHTSASITDLVEFIQDTVAASLVGSGVSITYDDTADTITITSIGGGGTDPEAVRDAIGVALVGVGLISVTPNDGADTITIATTATANSTDAALRDRSTHTGFQDIVTVTGLQAALDAKAAALGADDNYVTDAEKAALHSHSNQAALDLVSGTNTGDQTWSTLGGKPTTFAPIIGSGAGDAVAGNDSRLTDARTPTSHTHPSSAISDSTAVGRAGLTAATQADGRAAIGAGTSNLAVGSGAGDAKPGNYAPAAADISDSTTVGRNVLKAASQAAARAAIDAPAVADIITHRQVLTFSKGGVLTTYTGPFRLPNPTGRTLTIISVRATVGTQPTGASIKVDVNKNGTTIFTNQAHRPEIAVSTNAASDTGVDVTTWAANDYLTVDIDQIGSTVAGSDLVVSVVVEG